MVQQLQRWVNKMKKSDKVKFYIKTMVGEFTRPAGTKFIQTINNEDVTVSRMKHMMYMHKATIIFLKAM